VSRRTSNFAGFIVCAALLAYALYSQYHLGLDPCPLCILQRIGVVLMGLAFLLAALHHPHGAGRCVYGVAIGVFALATLSVAGRQLYIQHLPPGSIPSCGAPLALMFKFLPVTEVIRRVLTGSGECAEVNWRFLGLAMPAWVLIWSLLLGGAGVLSNFRPEAAGSRVR
jgi:protein dithiol:quinone oxidoreductase